MKLNKLSFGTCVIPSGQKTSVTNADPILTANSTSGKFNISSPVAKILNIAPGDNAQFITNIPQVEAAIAERRADIVEAAKEMGIDIETAEGQALLIKEFGFYGLAKGHKLFDKNGNVKMVAKRVSKEEKEAYLAKNSAELIEDNREALTEAYGDLTDEEFAKKLTVDMFEVPMVEDYAGSKTAGSDFSGVGSPVSFTDSSIWASLKKDLEDPSSKNRNYAIDINTIESCTVFNGYEEVEVKYVTLGEIKDVPPMKREKKSKNDSAETIVEVAEEESEK